MYHVKRVRLDEFQITADYYITVDMDNLSRPFGIRVTEDSGRSEEVGGVYSIALDAYSAAERCADNGVLPGNLRDVICDELIKTLI